MVGAWSAWQHNWVMPRRPDRMGRDRRPRRSAARGSGLLGTTEGTSQGAPPVHGYIDTDDRLGWNADQCAAYAFGRSRVTFCRELFEGRYEYPPNACRPLATLFEQEWCVSIPTVAQSYIDCMDAIGTERNAWQRVNPLTSQWDGAFEGKRDEAAEWEDLQRAVRRDVRGHLDLGAGIGVLVDDEPALRNYVLAGSLADVIEDVYRAAQEAGIPEKWLYGLVQKMQSHADVKRRFTDVEHAPGWEKWLERLDGALSAAARRELARTARVKPLSPTERAKLLKAKRQIDRKTRFVGESEASLRLFGRLDDLIQPDAHRPITLLGEKGCGKTFLAELVHESRRSGARFEEINAATFAGSDFNIAKGKLVGYGPTHGIPGIPPGGQPGLLETCGKGTIFLDEFMDLPHEMQTLLLAVFDRKPVQNIGGGRLNPSYPDFILAANKDPDAEIQDGRLRADLWDRLKAFAVRVPPLRDRREDVIAWVSTKCRKPEPRALLALLRYHWPGNVRELENRIDLALGASKRSRGTSATARGCDLLFDCLPHEITATVADLPDANVEFELLKFVVDLLRERGMEKGKGLNRGVAKMLGLSESWASKKLKAHPGI